MESHAWIERTSLCLASSIPGIAAHNHDEGFQAAVQKHFTNPESNANEQLVLLKSKLATASKDEFWRELMEGMTSITGAQYAFVAKRILVDDQDSAVEMPPIGEPGSCLMAVAFYFNDGGANRQHHRDYKYLAYGAPCAHMKHDKVFMIPDGLPDFVTDNPTEFAFPVDAYLGIPLFWEGKCFAHCGTMWSADGLKKRGLGWGYVEVLLHALEDLIIQKLVEGDNFAKVGKPGTPVAVVPQAAVSAAQSLRPYARSLSHELRTPMHGVVGMLEIMYATVQESLEAHTDEKVRQVFKTLRDNIEIVQDSSQRAVEAADNVVHAYDLNMEVPGTPDQPRDDESLDVLGEIAPRPAAVEKGRNSSLKGIKRQRSDSIEQNFEHSAKHQALGSKSTPRRSVSPRTVSHRSIEMESGDETQSSLQNCDTKSRPKTLQSNIEITSSPGCALGDRLEDNEVTSELLPHTKVRKLFQSVTSECLRMGGRPDSAIAEDTEFGETIEVRNRNSNGEASVKNIEWYVDPAVPQEIMVDERDLAKLISVVLLNAIKFTECGKISLRATLSPKARYIVINVQDTGSGIPKAFQPYLFKPFSREDDSTTRQNEGLGLGLLVAKALARKLGGDLLCIRSDTQGSQQGSDFEIRVPLSPPDSASRTGTPSRSPTPSSVPIGAVPRPSTPDAERVTRDGRKSPNRSPPKFVGFNLRPCCKAGSPLLASSSSRRNSLSQVRSPSTRRASGKRLPTFDRNLARKYPVNILVAEDNKINRRLLVNMLSKLGYTLIHEAFDGAEAVRLMSINRSAKGEKQIDVILMDLWMPNMDGYEAAERILAMEKHNFERHRNQGKDDRWGQKSRIKILAVTADVTDEAIDRARDVGMIGFMTKPYKIVDLERLILEHCSDRGG